VKVLRGPRGSPGTIKVARPGVPQPIEYHLVREEIHVNSVRTAYLIEPGVGYAKLDLFSETSTSDLRTAIARMKQEGMRAMILDLRANPGGLLDQGVSVSDLFLPPGKPIVETRARNPRDNVTFRSSRPEEFAEMPIVVLVDQFSASASEIVAGALQDHDRAVVLGVPTFGKGSVQTLFPLSGGNYLKMTTGKWYTPVGRSIQKDGHADVEDLLAMAEEPIADDGTPVPVEDPVDPAEREAYRTEGGRIVFGGGGIVPDLNVRPDTLTAAEREFFDAASRAGNKYSDAIFRYAVDFARRNPDLQPNFAVTPEMERELYEVLRADGVEVTWEQMQNARRLVARHVGNEIALAKWGQEGRAQRVNRDDNVIRTAIELLRQASSQEALFGMVNTRSTAR
jgi:carboxyl-terminal processing protease